MTHTLTLPIQNVSCEACEKVIGRILQKIPQARIESLSQDGKTLTLTCREEDVHLIKSRLREYDYLDEGNYSGSHLTHTLTRILTNAKGFEAEHRLLQYTIGCLVMASLAMYGAFQFLAAGNDSVARQWPILALLPIGTALVGGSLLHIRPLREHFNCTHGMMAGMGIGMMSGFMSGALMGATNGMFMGSVGGMIIGMGISAYAMRKNGIMSILEGLMAGLMSGTMGAMLSVMMITDHLIEFLYILFGVSFLILGGMSYFMLQEVGPIQSEKKTIRFIPFVGFCLVAMLLILTLIVWGPKSAFVWGGFA